MRQLVATTRNLQKTRGRRNRDAAVEDNLVEVMESFEFLSPHSSSDMVTNVVIMDRGTLKISDALLGANNRGKHLIGEFITDRLMKNKETGIVRKSYNEHVKKNVPLTPTDLRQRNLTRWL
ncbi:hypothetical protein JTB14_004322 [Gonioctena quinquepunctata]|nr:hypothetical protein JTB14_004322 [Gonioctena quinquepunctata]